MRKPVSVSVSSAVDGETTFFLDTVLVLCDDGTIWASRRKDGGNFRLWEQLPEIPQDESNPRV